MKRFGVGRSRGLRVTGRLGTAVLLAAFVTHAQAQPPRSDLIVEVRLVEGDLGGDASAPALAEGSARQALSVTGTTTTTRPAKADMPRNQTLHILNGTRGFVHFSRALPAESVMAVSGRTPGPRASGASNATSAASAAAGGTIVKAVTWQHAGYGLAILPVWPGGSAPVTVQIELDISRVDEKFAAEIPSSSKERVATSVVSTLGQWTTFARLGPAQQESEGHTWSTTAARERQTQWLQVKVQRAR